MRLLVCALAVMFAGAFLCLAAVGRPRTARVLGPSITVIGCLCGLVPVFMALAGAAIPAMRMPWNMPCGSISLELDALAAIFALPILVLCALAAIYGAEYLRSFETRRDLAVTWFFFNLLAGSMLLVVVARNAMLFLLAWETMSLASFFLVTFENERENVRRAGWTYLVATHIGTALLLLMFALLGRHGGTLDFKGFAGAGAVPGLATAVFLLALAGFGTKAGFIPMHVWLPEAHPAAPSHVSAVMSGVMIKTGIYGLLRTLTFIGAPPPWWGWTLVGVGAVSGILGVLLALAQHDLKRLLAYHSVENIGIIALGIGVGLLGVSYASPTMAFLGFAGSLLHVINHALFKGLLFLSAGSVLHAAGTREIDRLGGLLKSMPVTGGVFLVGSVAICGLPPLNGFVSEFLIYLGALWALVKTAQLPVEAAGAGVMVLAALALIGGLAVACFTKAFGVIFLGEARGPAAARARESAAAMRIPMVTLAGLCCLIGCSAPFLPPLLQPAVAVLAGGAAAVPAAAWSGSALAAIPAVTLGAALLAWLCLRMRRSLLAKQPVAQTVTWDCGYAAPTPRMQYTASSFADPITRMFRPILRTLFHSQPPAGLFPEAASLASHTPDFFHERIYHYLFTRAESLLARFRLLQHGRLNLYILYIMLALLGLLAWKMV